MSMDNNFNNMIGFDSLLGINLFADEILESFILHIPHSSVTIPDWSGFNIDNPAIIQNELQKLTDWKTDEIFNVKGITRFKAEFSRLFCDVERFYPDEFEPMAQFGRCFFYTKTDDGNDLRKDDDILKQSVLNDYYLKYHSDFTKIVSEKLENLSLVHIIDCHSFSDEPLMSDLDTSSPRPDICLGTDDFHTPDYLLDYVNLYFEKLNFSVSINSPYSGTLIPMKFFRNEKNVKGLMIEINKKLYMAGDNIINVKVFQLNQIITGLFNQIS